MSGATISFPQDCLYNFSNDDKSPQRPLIDHPTDESAEFSVCCITLSNLEIIAEMCKLLSIESTMIVAIPICLRFVSCKYKSNLWHLQLFLQKRLWIYLFIEPIARNRVKGGKNTRRFHSLKTYIRYTLIVV